MEPTSRIISADGSPRPLDKRSHGHLARLDRDYAVAAWSATLRQQVCEEAAVEYGISTEEYLDAMGLICNTEFKRRPKLMDPIEADHAAAFIIANAKEKKRVREEAADTMRHVRELNMQAYMRANHLQLV